MFDILVTIQLSGSEIFVFIKTNQILTLNIRELMILSQPINNFNKVHEKDEMTFYSFAVQCGKKHKTNK